MLKNVLKKALKNKIIPSGSLLFKKYSGFFNQGHMTIALTSNTLQNQTFIHAFCNSAEYLKDFANLHSPGVKIIDYKHYKEQGGVQFTHYALFEDWLYC